MDSRSFEKSNLFDIKQIIDSNKKMLIVSHYNPDGDAIGSSFGLYYFLKYILSKACCIYNRDDIPHYLSFLKSEEIPFYNSIENLPKDLDLIILLDLNDLERTGKEMETYINSKMKDKDLSIIVIDHHENNKIYNAQGTYIDSEASSTGILVHRLIMEFQKEIKVAIDSRISTSLLATIITDTSSFRNSNVNVETFDVCTKLLSGGGDLELINNNVYDSGEIKRLELKSSIYSTLEFYKQLKTAICYCTRSFYDKTSTSKEDSEGIANSLLNYSDVEIGIFIREIDNDKWKISLRANGFKDLSDFAQKFEGGGHKNASGFTFNGKLEALTEKIINELKNG